MFLSTKRKHLKNKLNHNKIKSFRNYRKNIDKVKYLKIILQQTLKIPITFGE